MIVNDNGVVGTEVVNIGRAPTVNVNVLLLVCTGTLESLTVTVYVVRLLAEVGVPVICPVLKFNSNPLGNVGLILNDNAPDPPVAEIGINAVAGIDCVKIVFGTSCLVTIGLGITSKANVLFAVCK